MNDITKIYELLDIVATLETSSFLSSVHVSLVKYHIHNDDIEQATQSLIRLIDRLEDDNTKYHLKLYKSANGTALSNLYKALQLITMHDSDGFSNAHRWVFVSFSGGKDSVSSYLEARKQYPKHIIQCVFTDTGFEHPETYEYLRYFDSHVHPVIRLSSRIVREKNGRRYFENVRVSWDESAQWVRENCHTVLDEFKDRYQRRPTAPPFPSGNARPCTKTVKVRVFERYVRSIVPKSERHLAVAVIGIRHGESKRRATRHETGVNTDCGHDEWYPITRYSCLDTFRAARNADIEFNQVYRYSPRSNCVWCPFASMETIRETERRHPGIMDGIKSFESDSGWDLKFGSSVTESCTSGFCET